jgi:pimeloyl-ACP methyl ester carboxylesterase
VSAFIATGIGPIESWRDPEESRRHRAEAKAALAAGDDSLKRFSLGFCRNNYAAPARSFLSYMQWSRVRILQALKASPVPTTVVIGQADKWLPPDWADTIKREGIPLVLINDANHYFSGIGEFDFQAAVRSLVEDATRAKPLRR